MNDEPELRRIAGESIADGKLPSRAPQQTWGGPGTGVKCALCRGRIDNDQLEFEVEFGRDAGRYHLHLACFSAWDAERKAIGARKPAASGDPAADGARPLATSAALSASPSSDKKTALPARPSDGKITAHGGESAYKPGAA